MALYTPRNVPLNWYRFDASGSVELLAAYVEDIETQVAKGIAEYKANTNTTVVKNFDEDSVVGLHKGLDDGTWHFPEVFEVYFPNLQRRSALITLYSFFEHELDKLCDLIRKQDKLLAKVTDMTDTGVKRSALYLSKLGGIDPGLNTHHWEKIQNIKHIRNLVVHADGRLEDGEVRKKKEDAIIEKSPLLEGGREVIIKDGYLLEVLKTFDDYFKFLDANLSAKYLV
ncbi:MAG: hypothetical protein V4614_15465 [Pseudomonadota bacterium]